MLTKLYIGNMSYKTDKAGLENAFSKYATSGQVEDAFLPTDRETGRPRGFAFVTFASAEEADAAIAGMDGQDLDGRNIRVNLAQAKSGGGGGGSGGFRSSGGSSGYSNNSYGGNNGYNSYGGNNGAAQDWGQPAASAGTDNGEWGSAGNQSSSNNNSGGW